MTSALEPVQTIFTACVAVTVANAFWIAVLHAKQTILLGRIERAEERIREAQAEAHAQALRLAQAEAEIDNQEARLYLREVTSRSECSSRLT